VALNYNRYPDGGVAHLIYPNGWRMRKNYTSRGQLANVGWDDSAGNATWQMLNYTYLADGKIDHQDYYHARETFSYDTRGFLSSLHHYNQYDNWNYTTRTYYRDNRDRIYAWAKGTDASYNAKENGRGDRYGYDAEGQLTTSTYQTSDPAGSASSPQRGWESFTYDALGNRKGSNILANRGSVTVTRRDNGLNEYLNWGGGRADYDDFYTPGANGVMIQNGLISSDFNALNQPNWVWSSPMPYVEAMGYDPLGRCVKRSSTGSLDPSANPATYFYYDGNDLIEEGSGATTPSKFYFHGGRIDELAASCDANGSGSSFRFYHYDANGNCILLTDMGGNLLEQYEYDAFGKPYFFTSYGSQLSASNYGNRFLFTGREWLSELGLYDYRARLYQPELGRFLQPDPKEFDAGDYNIYRYCHNDPVNHSDPMGLGPERDFIAGVGDALTLGQAEKVAEFFYPGYIASIDKSSAAYRLAGPVGIVAGMMDGAGEVGAVRAITKGDAAGRSFRTILRDIKENAGNWVRQSAHTEARQGGKGTSIQEIYQNKKTGEQVVKHTVVTEKGRVVDEHFRPMYKPRKGE
ncbi:MAG: RHS repeat-associated core domain-containing protein, partial [Verrucomicrobiota bacterium]|nr:RHS repeat-associated core domain-containing protein [Verrucomicrobiota bacterium]